MARTPRVALCALLIALFAAPAEARRLALVIGNDSYQNVQQLKNARADAKAIAAELKTVGFEVTLKQDLNQKLMKSALRDFKAQVQGGDEVVFYFSGHGVQFGGSNYLIPIDITADSEAQVADDAIPLQRILDDLTDQKARFSLAIIDACRSNPFKEAGRAIGGRGLASVTPATGQMIMYSAGAGQAALDNLGPKDTSPNGVFTRVLIQEMRKPGVPAGVLLKDVQSDVVELAHSVNHEQVPALYDQSLGKFFFRPGAPGAAAADGAAAQPAASIHVPTAAELDESYWQGIKASSDASDFAAYTKNFPKGMHVAEAEMMSRKLQRSTPQKAAAPAAAAARVVRIVLVPGGPFPAWATSNLLPGVVGRPTLTINKDGSIDCADAFGNRSHAVLNISDPNNITGKQATHLGFMNHAQIRYPDGSTDTEVTLQGKLVNNEITGTWYDKFQHGEFGWTVRTATVP
ncbi:MAG TPA: caspase family protein [Steroidobacteraceae bacterium]